MNKETETVSLCLRIPKEISDWLQEIAKPQAKSRSSVIRDILYNIYIKNKD